MRSPRPDQRDPAALHVYELVNGARLTAGDRVRFTEAAELEGAGRIEAGAEALVDDVQRHRHNRAIVELDDGRRASIYAQTPLEIVRPAREPVPVEPSGQEAQREPELAEGVAAHQERWTPPLPAAKPLELVARWEATDQVSRALALYDALGQLHLSPERDAARLWLADPQAAIVVQTWEQAEAVREAIFQEQATGRPPGLTSAPTVLLASAAYWSRAEAERAGEAALVPERAYVVAGLADHDALTRALSVAPGVPPRHRAPRPTHGGAAGPTRRRDRRVHGGRPGRGRDPGPTPLWRRASGCGRALRRAGDRDCPAAGRGRTPGRAGSPA